MIDALWNAAKKWSAANPEVSSERIEGEDGQFVELVWTRAFGDFAYIDLFPDEADSVIVQYGTFYETDRREPCGVTRFVLSEIVPTLDRLKKTIADARPRRWTYRPNVEIGVVSSLKFH